MRHLERGAYSRVALIWFKCEKVRRLFDAWRILEETQCLRLLKQSRKKFTSILKTSTFNQQAFLILVKVFSPSSEIDLNFFNISGGKMGTLLHSMFFLGLGMAAFKTTEGYQRPYKDPFIYMRGGPIKERSLFDANGNIVQDNF